MTSRRSLPALPMVLSMVSALSLPACFITPASAADFGFDGATRAAAEEAASAAPENFGVPCAIGQPVWAPPAPTAETLPWRSVWFGHFSGGRPYIDVYGRTLVDWRDEKVCFASKSQCRAWIRDLRRAFHRPEGYWTCLLLR